jgi:hypothetical protein
MTFIFLASSSSCFLFGPIFKKKSLTSLSAVVSVSSSVFSLLALFFGKKSRSKGIRRNDRWKTESAIGQLKEQRNGQHDSPMVREIQL